MDIDPEALGKELGSLWQREGARRSVAHWGACPQLKSVCDITDRDPPTEWRHKLHRTVENLLADAAESKTLLLVALGLHPSAQQSSLERRLDWLARERHVSTRTLQRRLPEVIGLFTTAAVAASRDPSAPDDVGYVTDHFDGTLDRTEDEWALVSERRKISIVQPGLDLLQCWRSLARPLVDREHRIDVYVGGRSMSYTTRQRGEVLDYLIPMPEPLSVGQVYEFTVTHRLPTGILRPFYVVHPCAPFGSASLTVRFNPQRTPQRAWRVDSARPGEFETCRSDAKVLRLDPSAQLRANFEGLREGRCYGIAWQW